MRSLFFSLVSFICLSASAQCDLVLVTNAAPIPCVDTLPGLATVATTGGTEPFQFLWSTGDTTQSIEPFVADTFGIVVTDAAGCVDSATVVVTAAERPELEADAFGESCAGDDGSIFLNIFGGTAPFDLSWTGDLSDTTQVDSLTAGTYTAIVTDANACSDTLSVEVPDLCVDTTGCADLIAGKVLNFTLPDCSDTLQFCLDIPLSDFGLLTLTDNGQAYTGPVNGCNFDTSFQYAYGLLPDGNGFELQNWMVNDTSFMGTFATVGELVDSLNLWDPAGNWSIDTAQLIIEGGLPGTQYGSLDVSQLMGDTVVMLAVNENLLPQGTQLELTNGVHELIVTTPGGCMDTVTTIVNCGDGTGIFFSFPYTIPQGRPDTLCLSDFGLLLDSITVVPGGCAAAPNSIVSFEIDNEAGCVNFTGLSEGTENVCFLICNPVGCDTLQIGLNVVPDVPLLPLAFNDTLQLDKNTSITFSVLLNDVLFDSFSSLNIDQPATNGTANLTPDNLFSYTPDPGFSGIDSFSYVLCNVNGCDTATVLLEVIETEVVIPAGFSPNGDGVNDTWEIRGLNNFPDHELMVFNRWGNEVFAITNYQGDWEGRYDNNDLADGVYFYVLEPNLPGAEIMTGYVVIMR